MNLEKIPHSETASALERPGQRVGHLVIEAAEMNLESRQVPYCGRSFELKLTDFNELYSTHKLERDQAYVERTEARFNHDPDSGKLAQTFERIFAQGVQIGRWLGNLPSADGEQFTTQTFAATRYDDLSHRVDAFSTLTFAESFEGSAGLELTTLPLAFDVTLQVDRAKVLDKLTRSYNDNRQLPFGFSSIDYYTDGEVEHYLPLVPRYVIGVSGEEVQQLAETFQRGNEDSKWLPNMLSPQMLQARFKVLSEIRAQNELFEAMLPDDAYDSEDPLIQRASTYIEAADENLKHALAVCSRELIARRYVPYEVLEYAKSHPNSPNLRQQIENALLHKAHDHFIEEGMDRCRRNGEIFDQHTTDDDTFVQIITLTRTLTQATYDENRRASLDSHRHIAVHNRNFEIPV